LEFKSINVDLRQFLEDRFSIVVVDDRKETKDNIDTYKFLVQFPDADSIIKFKEEIEHYSNEENETFALPPGMRRNFFDSLQNIDNVSKEYRTGERLRQDGFPEEETFYMDVDLWHPGTPYVSRLMNEVRQLCYKYEGEVTDSVHTSSLLLTKVHGSKKLGEALLESDFVARVDLPPILSEAYSCIFQNVAIPDPDLRPSGSEPLVCIIDTGVIAGHPLLRNWVIEEYDFDTGEGTSVDQNGHGTSVAGIVVYGDIARCLEQNLWQPKVMICSAKIFYHDKKSDSAKIPSHLRVEEQTEKAIRYYSKQRNCRIFNLSLGMRKEIYNGGRQFPWAEKLDQLSRELDIVIIVSAGNRFNLPIPDDAMTRSQLHCSVLNQLLTEDQRICNPASASLALTIGAIARSDAVTTPQGEGLRDAIAGSPSGAPSPFTRTGPGYSIDTTKSQIKPEIVHYGGNLAIQCVAGDEPRWANDYIYLGEPTIQKEEDGRIVCAKSGTSFSCPHVSHAAALALKSLENTLGRSPSANLIRALVGSTAVCPPCREDFYADEDANLRIVGYGMCDTEEVIYSSENNVRLIAMDEVEENKLHIYQVSIPLSFVTTKGRRALTVSLAYDPPVRASRKEYLARTMWVEALHGLTPDEVKKYKAKFHGENPPSLPTTNVIDLKPVKTTVQWSTLQVRRKKWARSMLLRSPLNHSEPLLHILVGCQQRFPTGLDPKQKYGLVIHFWHENSHIELYQSLRSHNRVRLPAVRIRTEH